MKLGLAGRLTNGFIDSPLTPLLLLSALAPLTAGLLAVPSLQSDFLPRSAGGRLAAERDGGANARHRGDPAADTGAFGADPGPGNMRVDYVLPSRGLPIEDGGVYWPAPGQTGADWIEASDHRLVWVRVGQVT